jgi:hypothetical protein
MEPVSWSRAGGAPVNTVNEDFLAWVAAIKRKMNHGCLLWVDPFFLFLAKLRYSSNFRTMNARPFARV